MPWFERDGLSFHFHDRGEGLAFVFQHGLGGDASQALGLYAPPRGVRMIGMDCRAHGRTTPLGDPKTVAIAPFADDIVALLDHLGINRAVVGGVSMGAAVALSLGLRYPERVLGLVLARPAGLDRPLPESARVFARAAQFLLKFGAEEGLERFRASAGFQRLAADAPEAARSLEQQFRDPRAEECVVRLERIPHDCPAHDRKEFATVAAPVLVLGSDDDPLHPWEFAEVLARTIPGASLVALTPPSISLERHAAEFQAAVDAFLAPFLRPDGSAG